MTHYDINYSAMSDEEKQDKAIKDIIDFVGQAKFDELNSLLLELMKERNAHKPMTLEQFQMILFMFPVSGYPIEAWYKVLKEQI